MNHKLIIKHFGPIERAEISVNNLMVFIGPSASGKSTISKVIYFFQNIRDKYIEFVFKETIGNNKLNELGELKNELGELKEEEFIINLSKYIQLEFVNFWGVLEFNNDLELKYSYKEDNGKDSYILIDANNEKSTSYINIKISDFMKKELFNAYKDFLNGVFRHKSIGKNRTAFLDLDEILNYYMHKGRNILNKKSEELFNFSEQLLYIPAGRGFLSILSHYSGKDLIDDYFMKKFIGRVNRNKKIFSKSLEEIINEKKLIKGGEVVGKWSDKVINIINEILKGKYTYDIKNNIERLVINEAVSIKMSSASSGQQEILWILLTLFLMILENASVRVFIEEPEAHLFPEAQKQVIELLALLMGSVQAKFVLTTHSPYILSAVNNHLYGYRLKEEFPEREQKINSVIDVRTLINVQQVAGFLVESGKITDLIDKELGLIKVELIDGASSLINEQYDKLFSIEYQKF